MSEERSFDVGIDVGTECVKAVVIDDAGMLLGNAVVARRGYFQDRVTEAFATVLDDAQVSREDISEVCATGFAENCVPMATSFRGETACHALGAFHHHPHAMTVVDIGGRDPKVIHVSDRGCPTAIHTLRRCAAGIGTFLIFAARHLDVSPTRMQEMAAMADAPVDVGSYCSMFSGQDILEKLRDGATREEVALGCIHSIADRVVEIGRFHGTIRLTGGVAEYFPGVLQALAEKLQLPVEAVPQPILAGALGAALWGQRSRQANHCKQGEV
jgi:predicted CoA-substrate-specific enzyme activase